MPQSPYLPLKTHVSGELREFTVPCASGTPGVAFAKAPTGTRGITSAVSLLGRELSVAMLCLSELSIMSHSRTVSVLYKFILRDHVLQERKAVGSLNTLARKLLRLN